MENFGRFTLLSIIEMNIYFVKENPYYIIPEAIMTNYSASQDLIASGA